MKNLILITMMIIYGGSISAQSKEVLDQKISEIEALQNDKTLITIWSIDVSTSSLGISDKGKTNIINVSSSSLRKPGDQVCVCYISDNSSSQSNLYCSTVEGSVPSFTGDKSDVKKILAFRKTMKSEKRRILKTLLNAHLSFKNDRNATEILESFTPVLTANWNIEDNVSWYIVSDLHQSSSYSTNTDILADDTLKYARNSGKAISKALMKDYDIPPNAGKKIDTIAFWLTQGINSSDRGTSLMPIYFKEVLKGIGYDGQFSVDAEYIN